MVGWCGWDSSPQSLWICRSRDYSYNGPAPALRASSPQGARKKVTFEGLLGDIIMYIYNWYVLIYNTNFSLAPWGSRRLSISEYVSEGVTLWRVRGMVGLSLLPQKWVSWARWCVCPNSIRWLLAIWHKVRWGQSYSIRQYPRCGLSLKVEWWWQWTCHRVPR